MITEKLAPGTELVAQNIRRVEAARLEDTNLQDLALLNTAYYKENRALIKERFGMTTKESESE